MSLLGNLPRLKSLDLADSVLSIAPFSTPRNLRHSQLASLAIHASALATLEQSLSDGLNLPLYSSPLAQWSYQHDFFSIQLPFNIIAAEYDGHRVGVQTIKMEELYTLMDRRLHYR